MKELALKILAVHLQKIPVEQKLNEIIRTTIFKLNQHDARLAKLWRETKEKPTYSE